MRGAPGRREIFDELRVELCVGQSLDLVGTATAAPTPSSRTASRRLQVGQVHGRAAAAPRRRARRPPRRARDRALGDRAAARARRSSSATTCSARSATPRSPASRSATTSARASPRRWSRSRPRAPTDADRELLGRLGDRRPDRRRRRRAAGRCSCAPARSTRSRPTIERLVVEARDALAARPDHRRPRAPGSTSSRPTSPGGTDSRDGRRDVAMPPLPDPAISVAGLEKRYGATRRSTGSTSTSAAGEVFGLLGPERRGQDHDGRDPRGLPHARRRRRCACSASTRSRDGAAAAPAHRRDAAGGRPLSRACGRSSCSRLFAAYYDDADDRPTRCSTSSACATRRARRCGGCRAARRSGSRSRARSIGRPEVVFLDEPTAGMDPHARATTWQLVRDLRDRGVTVLLTTHAMDEAEHLCDRVAIITGGRLAALGSPAELTRHAAADEICVRGRRPASTSTCSPRRSASTTATCVEDRAGRVRRARRGHAGAHRRPRVLPARPRRHARRAAAGRRSLEEVFLQITAERGARERERARALVAQARAETRAAAAAGREPASSRSRSRSASSCSSPRSTTISTDFAHPGRLPRARRAVARGDGGRDGVARHRHRLRAALRRAEAPRLDAAVARRPARRRRPRPCSRSRSLQVAAHRRASASRSAGTCPAGIVPARRPAAARHGRVRGHRHADGGHAAGRGEPRRRQRAVPRAAVPRRDGVPARQAARRAMQDVRQGCCPRPRCRRRCASVLSTAGVPGRRARRAARVGGRRAARSPPATSAGRSDPPPRRLSGSNFDP